MTKQPQEHNNNQLCIVTQSPQSIQYDETCFRTKNVRDILLKYSGVSALTRENLLNLYLVVSFACIETTFGPCAVADLLTITKNSVKSRFS